MEHGGLSRQKVICKDLQSDGRVVGRDETREAKETPETCLARCAKKEAAVCRETRIAFLAAESRADAARRNRASRMISPLYLSEKQAESRRI